MTSKTSTRSPPRWQTATLTPPTRCASTSATTRTVRGSSTPRTVTRATSRGRVGAPAAASLEHPSSTNDGGRVFSHGGIGSRRDRAAALSADLNMLLSAPEKTPPGPTCSALRRPRHSTRGTTAWIADSSGQSLIRLVHVRGRGPTGRLGHKRTETVPLIAVSYTHL